MNIWFNVLVYVVWFVATYYVVLMLILLLMHRKRIYEGRTGNFGTPMVSVIAPAYNEGKKIAFTIKSLKKITYPNIEFIIVNDGSKDNTADVVRKNTRGDSRFIFIDLKKNAGKANALNAGIKIAKGKFVACMDADSVVESEVFEKALPYFTDRKTGAVTISVQLLRPKSFLDKIVEIEYKIGLSLLLKLQSFFNCIYVTPGPFSIYRKSVLDKIGGFDPNNITEDLEIAYRIHKAGYKIDNCYEAKVSTIVPPTLKSLYVQRRRWYSGALQTIMQHRKMLFKRKHGLFSFMIPYNYALIFLGLALFLASIYLGVTNLVDTLSYFQYTNFNIWQRMLDFNFDFLNFGRISIVGLTSFLLGLTLVVLGLKISKVSLSKRKLGIIGFPLFYFLYQLFWLGSFIAFLRGKKVKWR